MYLTRVFFVLLLATGSRCMCSSGYTGQNCENEYIPCDPSPCKNGGTCHQIDGLDYQCICPEGFRGDQCEENIDDCPGNLCQNGATCMDRINEYSCLCPPSYTGTQCELDVDECSVRPSLCHNGATCTNSPGSYSCICVNGWTGPDCSVNIDDCAGAACFNGATCIDRVGSFYCQCTYGKTGLLCHLDDACTSNPCHEGAICDTSPINGSFACSCATGYKGVDCSEDIDECEQGSPCEHDGICVNTPGSFACNCAQGFTGPRCETNVNECESHPCQNDGSCLDDPGTFRCVCMPELDGRKRRRGERPKGEKRACFSARDVPGLPQTHWNITTMAKQRPYRSPKELFPRDPEKTSQLKLTGNRSNVSTMLEIGTTLAGKRGFS